MPLDPVNEDANHQQFLEKILATQTVWYLESEDGVANSTSLEEEGDEEESTVFMFWSDKEYATAVRKEEGFEDYRESSMDLFDFIYRWLPGMGSDAILAGTNWTADLDGIEIDPVDLREEIEAIMPDSMKQDYDARCLLLMKEEDSI